MESKLSSAAAFVEGGVLDACGDTCSICLEAFCHSDPSTMTSCKHDYHLQCILEWCQRSSQCPMCWQPISMKDALSQELLEAVEEERKIRDKRSRAAAVFHHPLLGDFEVPEGADDSQYHLIAAAEMRRPRRYDRRNGHHRLSGANGRSQFLVLSTNGVTSGSSVHTTSGQETYYVESPAVVSGIEQVHPIGAWQLNTCCSDQGATDPSPHGGITVNRTSEDEPVPFSQDEAGSSRIVRSPLQSASIKYKNPITKSMRGWKERWFSQTNCISDLGSGVRMEVSAGIAAVNRMMERHEATGSVGPSTTSAASVGSSLDANNKGSGIAAKFEVSSGPGMTPSVQEVVCALEVH